jgi:hypothetical protein
MPTHPRVSVALAVLAALLAAAAAAAGYARLELADRSAFSTRAASALGDEDLRLVLAERVVDGLAQSVAPDVLAVRPLLTPALAALANTRAFRRAFTAAIASRHRALFEGRSRFVLRLDRGRALLAGAVRSVSPRAAHALPRELGPELVDLSPGDSELAAARALSSVAGWWWPLVAATVLAAGACAALAGGARTAVLHLGAAAALAGLITAVWVTALGVALVAHAAHAANAANVDEPRARAAFGALWYAFFGDLRTAALTAALGGAVIAALAAGVTVRDRLAAAARRAGRFARSPRTAARLARAVVLVALGVGLLLQPSLVARGLLVAAGAVLVLLGVAQVTGAAQRRAGAREGGAGAPRLLVGGVVAVLAGTVAAIALVVPAPPAAAPEAGAAPAGGCNGSRELCARRLDEVVFPATHNSYAAADEPGWLFANQRYGIARQLRDGIRALLIDIHYGIRDPRTGRVRTDLRAEGSSRNKVARQLSPAALRTADRLAGRVGRSLPSGRPGLYLCHTLCELGSEPLDRELAVIRRFLSAHPGAVLILFVEPYVPVVAIGQALEKADLLSEAAPLRRDEPLPTFGDLVRARTRLIVLAEEDGGTRPWYLPGFSFVQDTPLEGRTAGGLSCRRFRGNADSPMLLVNHWIFSFPPAPSRNERIGDGVLRRRLAQCERQRGLLPNLVAVDFYERSGVVRIANELNAQRR